MAIVMSLHSFFSIIMSVTIFVFNKSPTNHPYVMILVMAKKLRTDEAFLFYSLSMNSFVVRFESI
ncbi:MAG: hypothetical protein HW420_413 [Candidatus Nitrosotenuis sp.]|nr:hypothetical protein [Candidatus Nitrosotenuis sp.]